jgi:PAS domain S-box-containing protein
MSVSDQNTVAGQGGMLQDEQARHDLAVRCNAELYRTFRKQIFAAVTVSGLNAVLVTGVVWNAVPQVPLIAWSGFLVCLSVLRLLIFALGRDDKNISDEEATKLRRTATAVISIGGVAWGLGEVFIILEAESIVHQVFMAFVLGGMSAGAMAGLTFCLPAFYGFCAPAILMGAGAYFVVGEQPHLIMGAMVLLFAGMLMYFARNVYLSMFNSVRLRFENFELFHRVAEAREAADALVIERTAELREANRELERRIQEQMTAEKAARDSERQLRLITENLPVLITFFGRDLRFRFGNRSSEDWFGVARNDMIGMHLSDLGDAVLAEAVDPHIEDVLAGNLVTFEDEREGQYGPKYHRILLVPHRDEGGETDGFVILAQDRTEERLGEAVLKESEDRLRRVIQNMPVMMFALDEKGNTIVWNRECERITGFSAEQIVGNPKGLNMLYPDEKSRQDLRDALLEHSDYRDWEWEITCSDGSAKTISWFNISSMYPVPGWAAWQMGFDVSDRKRTRLELEEALKKERELGELKSRFVAMASHEFRTPLTTIRASVDLLEHYGDRMQDEKKSSYLQEIAREVTNITGLLDDILTIGRAEAGRLELKPTPCDLHRLCAEMIEMSKPNAKPGHHFKFDWKGQLDPVNLDEQLVRHMVSNMLSNAVKYSPEGGLIHIAVVRDPEEISIAVTDEGIGIPESERDRIYEAFHRFPNVGAISGTGLGLAILKRAVERHGGRVEFESTVGEGTTWSVTLPLTSSPESEF